MLGPTLRLPISLQSCYEIPEHAAHGQALYAIAELNEPQQPKCISLSCNTYDSAFQWPTEPCKPGCMAQPPRPH